MRAVGIGKLVALGALAVSCAKTFLVIAVSVALGFVFAVGVGDSRGLHAIKITRANKQSKRIFTRYPPTVRTSNHESFSVYQVLSDLFQGVAIAGVGQARQNEMRPR